MSFLRPNAAAACGSALGAAIVASMIVAPPSTATTGEPVGATAADQTAIVTDSNAPDGPQLTPGPAISKKQIQRRNSEQYAGARPMWVQRPILERKRGKYSIFASATVSPHRGAAKYRKQQDRIDVTATVLPKSAAGQGLTSPETATYHKRVSVTPRKHGLVSVRIPVSKSTAKKVKRLEAQQARIVLTLVHAKDTFPKLGNVPDLHQYVPGAMTATKLRKAQVKRRVAVNLRVQRRIEKGKRPVTTTRAMAQSVSGAGQVRAQNLNQLYRRTLVVNNATPFTQAVQVNPNVACMQTDSLSGVYSQDLPPVSGEVQIFLANEGGTQGEIKPWAGSTTGNPPNAGGSVAVTDMTETGRQILDHLADELWNPEFYSSKGLIAGGLLTGIDLIAGALKALYDQENQCDPFGQYWAVTATAKTVGHVNGGEYVIYGTPKSWAYGTFTTTGKGTTSAEIGYPASHPNSLPAVGTSDLAGLESVLNSAVGQQTTVTYFDNGGMSAPVANAGGNKNWNGHAAYAQGLVQFIYPNMPSCMNNDCNNGTTAVQLGYLVDGFDDVVGPKLVRSPVATAETIVDPATKQQAISVECTIANDGNFSNPFGGKQGAPAESVDPELNSLPGSTGVDKALFAVTYFAQDAQGNFLYNADSVTGQFPGPVVGSPGAPPPNLKANGDGMQSVMMNQSTPTAVNLLPGDLDNLVNPVTGAPAEATRFGCAVIPVVSWKNMDVTANSQWGGNWPFPQQQSGGWLSSPWDNNFNFPNPVNALNVTWTGDTYLSAPVASPIYQPPTPTSVSPASGPVTGDTNVTISGSAFKPGAWVTIGGVGCSSVVVVDSETITCVTGAVTAADVRGDVVVTNPASGDSGTGKDLYTFTAEVGSVTPASGSAAGGTALTITGVGFGRDSTVMVGGKSCRFPNVVNVNKITCTTPTHPAGVVDIAVTNPRPNSTSTLPGAFTFAVPTLQVDHVYGSNLTTAGGKDITIYGPQLNGTETVTVGGRTCTNVRHFGSGIGTSDNYIACLAPSQSAAGQYDVVVSRTGYAPTTVTNALTYQ